MRGSGCYLSLNGRWHSVSFLHYSFKYLYTETCIDINCVIPVLDICTHRLKSTAFFLFLVLQHEVSRVYGLLLFFEAIFVLFLVAGRGLASVFLTYQVSSFFCRKEIHLVVAFLFPRSTSRHFATW